MKKRLAIALLLLSTVFGTVGCSSAWWQNFQSNPVAAVQAFEATTQTALTIAQQAWSALSPLLPLNILAQVQPRYQQAMIAANAALTALSDAVQAAIDVQNPNPDFTAAIQAVADAVDQVVAIVNDLHGTTYGITASTGLPELAQAVKTMKHVGHTK